MLDAPSIPANVFEIRGARVRLINPISSELVPRAWNGKTDAARNALPFVCE